MYGRNKESGSDRTKKDVELYNGVDGRGIYYYADGAFYDGMWQDQKKHGYGLYKWVSGETYEGEWKDDKQDGRGLFTCCDGSSYEGQFTNNMKNGFGTYTWASGQKFSGEWCNNEIVSNHQQQFQPPPPPPPTPPHYFKSFIASQTRPTHGSSSSSSSSSLPPSPWITEGQRRHAVVDEDDSDIREAIRRSLTESSLSNDISKVFVNRAGYRMCLGEQRGCTHLFYCSRWMGVDKIPGSDGQCGPNDGPQCADCHGAISSDSHRYISPNGTAKSAEYWMADEGDDHDSLMMEAIRRSQLDMQQIETRRGGKNMMIISTSDLKEDTTNIVSSTDSSRNNSSIDMQEMAYSSSPSKPASFPLQFINTTTDPTTTTSSSSSSSGNASTRPPTWFAVTPVQTHAPSSFTPVYHLAPSSSQQSSSSPHLHQQSSQLLPQPQPIPIRIPSQESAVCVICMVQPRTMAFAPCGHLCICTTCCDDLKKQRQLHHCVMCQTKATTCLRIFN